MKWAVLALGMAVLAGCSPRGETDLERLALPVAGSDRSDAMWNVWLGAWIASGVIFLIVLFLILFPAVAHRRRHADEVPPQVRYNLPIEALYTIAPVIIVAVFFFHTITAQNDMIEKVDDPDHTVTVVGSKWQWSFNYQDEQAVAEDVFDLGTPENPAELWLPVDESVRFELLSPDVIHSFWVPEFYFKMDVVPGRSNTFDMTPTREGTFTGRCAELCGTYHSRMIFKVHVVSRDEYDAHLQELEEAGNVGAPEGQEHAAKIAGLGDDDAQDGAGSSGVENDDAQDGAGS